MVITILVGTMTGTAELVADAVAGVLRDRNQAVCVERMDGLFCDVFADGGVFIICTSTYGKGDVPDNAAGLYGSLQRAKPNLGRVRYGVIGLGDQRYKKTFANGGKRFDAIMTELGATRVGARLDHDASSGVPAEECATEWAAKWLQNATESLALTPRDVSG